MLRHPLALLLAATTISFGLGCEGEKAPPPAPTAAPTGAAPAASTATATATAAAAAPTASAAAPAVDVPLYPPRKVPGGMVSGTWWVQQFEVVRDKGNLGLSYLDAMNRCMAYDKILCTDMEWARACETDAALAKIETWTASGVGSNRFVVRGGDETAACRARDVKDGAELAPARAAVCCDPNIVARSMSKDALLTTITRQLYAYQRAMKSRDALSLVGLYEDKVTWLGKERTNAEIIKVHQESFTKDPGQWTLFDQCTLAMDPSSAGAAAAGDAGADGGVDPNASATADCLTLFQRNGAVIVAMQRLVFAGSGKIKLIGDATTARATSAAGVVVEEKELKERVGILLSAD
jgi:hypothetical protein